MKVLVTGGAGYLGVVLVPRLLEAGYQVRVLDNLILGGEGLLPVYSHPRFEFILADLRESEAVAAALTDVEAVIHLAALVGDAQCEDQPEAAWAVNFEATRALVEASRALSVARFILASTCSCYGISDSDLLADEDSPLSPTSLYGETKIAAEASVVGLSGDNLVAGVLRLATLFGLSPRMRFDLLLNEFLKDALLERRLMIYGQAAWRPLLHVKDAADAFIRCMEVPLDRLDGQIYNVGFGNYQKGEMGAMLQRYVPDLELEFVAGKDDPRDYKVGFDKMVQKLGFRPLRDVEGGILEMKRAIETRIIANPADERYSNVRGKD